MKNIDIRQNKISYYCVISASLILLLLFAPLSAFAQDTESVDILRQMGKAFAKIAEKASPAVVGISTKQVVVQEYPTFHDRPFADPFEEDFFRRFFGRPSPRQPSPQQKYHRPVRGS
ncbi:MAG: hypothetical protein ACYS0C_00785, partial [Planctomycetota bacterium]